jgi:trafficking protein particle complex subunit 8
LKSTVGENTFPADLKPPFLFSSAVETKVRLVRQGELDVENVRWSAFEQSWSKFWENRGKERLEKSGKAVVGGQWYGVFLLRDLRLMPTS